MVAPSINYTPFYYGALSSASTGRDSYNTAGSSTGNSLFYFPTGYAILESKVTTIEETGKTLRVYSMPGEIFTIYEDDPEIKALSREELWALVEDAAGSWADREDITDTWLDDLRKGWYVDPDKYDLPNE